MKSILVAVIVVVLVVVAGVGGFFAGNSFGPNAQALSTVNDFRTQRFGNGGQGSTGQSGQGGQGAQQGRRPVAFGTVKSVQGNTIQVTAQDGTITTVTTDSKTVVQKTVTGAVTDVQPGQRITVMGNQSGSDVTATEISIQPSGQAGQ